MIEEANEVDSEGFVHSFARGLRVVSCFDADNAQLTLSEVAQRAELSRSAARRFLLTLTSLGYAGSDGKYFWLTPRILTLGYSFLAGETLVEMAAPHLRALSYLANESASLSVLDEGDIVYLLRTETKKIMRARIGVGTRFPAYATSMGRVLLAGLPPAELDAYLRQPGRVKLTPLTKVDAEELREVIEQARQQGWAIIADELEIGVGSMSAPVTNAKGEVVAAINVSIATGVQSIEALLELKPALVHTAAAISQDLVARESLSTSAGLGPVSIR